MIKDEVIWGINLPTHHLENQVAGKPGSLQGPETLEIAEGHSALVSFKIWQFELIFVYHCKTVYLLTLKVLLQKIKYQTD